MSLTGESWSFDRVLAFHFATQPDVPGALITRQSWSVHAEAP